MGDLESLLLVIAIIYLTECVVWIRRSSLAVQRGFGGRWRLRHPGVVWGNARGAIVLGSPLPSSGVVLLSHPFPMSLSAQAMLSFASVCLDSGGRPPQLARWVNFPEARTISAEGRSVLVNDAVFFKAASSSSARHLARLLRELKGLPEGGREAAIRRMLAASLDADGARRRWEEYAQWGGRLRWMGGILFAYLFAIAPAAIWLWGFEAAGLGVVMGLLAQTFAIGWQFWRAHGVLYPGGSEERFTPFLTMLLAPPTAIRAHDLLARRLVEGFHPLAVAQAFCPGLPFKQLARRVLLDLRYPLLPNAPSSQAAVVETEEWFRGVLLEECERFVERAGLNPGALTLPPERAEEKSQSYCPRCGAQFIVEAGHCADCGGRALVTFA